MTACCTASAPALSTASASTTAALPNDGRGSAGVHAGRRREHHSQQRPIPRWTTRARSTATTSSWTRRPARAICSTTDAWHTWLVGGLGPGGAGMYALDVTNPTSREFHGEQRAESGHRRVVEQHRSLRRMSLILRHQPRQHLWRAADPPAPQRQVGRALRQRHRQHLGRCGHVHDDRGPSNGSHTFYYLSTGKAGAATASRTSASADLDGDHITDYVYAGDLLGNVWRFDLTGSSPSSWAASQRAPVHDAFRAADHHAAGRRFGPLRRRRPAAHHRVRHGAENRHHEHERCHLLERHAEPVRHLGLESRRHGMRSRRRNTRAWLLPRLGLDIALHASSRRTCSSRHSR